MVTTMLLLLLVVVAEGWLGGCMGWEGDRGVGAGLGHGTLGRQACACCAACALIHGRECFQTQPATHDDHHAQPACPLPCHDPPPPQKTPVLVEQGLLGGWRAQLADVEARIPTLVGNAALAVACLTYLGPLDRPGRAAVLATWCELLKQHGVPVSPSFDFTAFVADRFTQVGGVSAGWGRGRGRKGSWLQLLACMLYAHRVCSHLTFVYITPTHPQHRAAPQMSPLLPSDLLANLEPLWRDNWSLMFMSRRPPLLLDPGREGANLIKAACGKSNRVFAVLTEEGLLDKVIGPGLGDGD